MKRAFLLLKQAFTQFIAHKAPRLGAALAYYTIFSIAPLLLIAVAIAGMVFGREAAQGELLGQLRGVLGPNAAREKFLSMAMVLGVGFLLLVSLVFDAAIAAMGGEALWQSVQLVISFGV